MNGIMILVAPQKANEGRSRMIAIELAETQLFDDTGRLLYHPRQRLKAPKVNLPSASHVF